MKITRETTTDEVLNVLSDHIEQVIAKIPAYPLKVPFYAMPIGDYLKCTMDGQYLWTLVADKMAYKTFGRLRQFRSECENLAKYLKRYEVEQTEDERRAAFGVPFPSSTERILTTCVKYYHLHSTAEAEKLPLSDYIVAYKDQMSDAMYQRNLAKIQTAKINKNAKSVR